MTPDFGRAAPPYAGLPTGPRLAHAGSTSRQTGLPDLAFVYFGGRWENADPDSKAINVLIWRGRYVAAGGRRGLRAISGAGAILMLDDTGGTPRPRRLRS